MVFSIGTQKGTLEERRRVRTDEHEKMKRYRYDRESHLPYSRKKDKRYR